MSVHLHTTLVEGCYRCDLNRDEVPTPPAFAHFASRLMPPSGVTADEVVCVCGNNSGVDGFVAVTSRGIEVEPTEADWPLPLWQCVRCDAIILDDISGMPS